MLKLQLPFARRLAGSAVRLLQTSRASSATVPAPAPEATPSPTPAPAPAPSPIQKPAAFSSSKNIKKEPIDTDIVPPKSGLVAAAFATLKGEIPVTNEKNSLGAIIESEVDRASDLDALLNVSVKYRLSKRQSLKVLSKLSEWSSTGKIKIEAFKSDPRFIAICHSLGKTTISGGNASAYSEDLGTILSITGDEEAAKLVSNLTAPQMIKVISTLASKKRRSTPILRALAFHISKSPDSLNLKQSSDLLYALAVLNFPDEVLLERICGDVQKSLKENADKSAVIGSIATSLGILKYKDVQTLETLTQWIVSHAEVARPQDVSSLVITLATLNHCPPGVDDLPELTEMDFLKPSSWLDYVWSLSVLDKVTETQLSAVFSENYLNSLKIDNEIPVAYQKKLANLNAYATLVMKNYKGLRPESVPFEELTVAYSKDKLAFVTCVHETLKSFLSSEQYIKKNCNSNMGFLYDAECVLDSKCHPHPINSQPKKGKSLSKIAILALDYHDISKQIREPLGSIMLYKRLLEKKDYKVVFIPYNEFDVKDKIVNRVQYIEKKLKETVKQI